MSVKNITRSTLRRFGSIYWPVLAGQSAFPVQTAVRYKVPLIIWGAHQGLEQVGMFSHEHEVEMTRRYRKDHDLLGHEADDLISQFDTLNERDIWQYRYPSDNELNREKVRGIYLGNYVRWDPKLQHEKMIDNYYYETSKFPRSFDCYDHTDCFNYMDLHDQIKLYKHGYSKVTDHATREIRFGRLTRSEGLALIKKYESSETQFHQQFCDWLGITQRALEFMMDLHRNREFWSEDRPNNWRFNGWSARNGSVEADRAVTLKGDAKFSDNSSLERNLAAKYITTGKGWP